MVWDPLWTIAVSDGRCLRDSLPSPLNPETVVLHLVIRVGGGPARGGIYDPFYYDRAPGCGGVHWDFHFRRPRMDPLHTRKPQRPRESFSSHNRPGSEAVTQPALTSLGLNPGLPGHSFDTAPPLCPRFAKPVSLRSPCVSLPAPARPRSAGASPRTGVGSDGSLPETTSSTARVSPSARPS